MDRPSFRLFCQGSGVLPVKQCLGLTCLLLRVLAALTSRCGYILIERVGITSRSLVAPSATWLSRRGRGVQPAHRLHLVKHSKPDQGGSPSLDLVFTCTCRVRRHGLAFACQNRGVSPESDMSASSSISLPLILRLDIPIPSSCPACLPGLMSEDERAILPTPPHIQPGSRSNAVLASPAPPILARPHQHFRRMWYGRLLPSDESRVLPIIVVVKCCACPKYPSRPHSAP